MPSFSNCACTLLTDKERGQHRFLTAMAATVPATCPICMETG